LPKAALAVSSNLAGFVRTIPVMSRLRLDHYLAFFCFCLSSVAIGLAFWPRTSLDQVIPPQASEEMTAFGGLQKVPEVVVPLFTGDVSAAAQISTISAQAVYVMDRTSGSILYQKNAEVSKYPASTAKIMTALVSRDIYPLERVLPVAEEAFTTGTVVGFQVGERLIVENLLKGLLINSGNDAAFVLANNHALGYQGFVQAMNEKAKALHLSQTRFQNPSGLDQGEQRASARDLAILSHELLKDSFLAEVVSTKSTIITDETGVIQHPLLNRNELLGKLEGVIGLKTGTTPSAGENLVTAYQKDGHELILVVLESKDRYADTRQLLTWLDQHYVWKNLSFPSQSSQ